MQTFRNLIPDSPLCQETFDIVRRSGGRAEAGFVADFVLGLPGLAPAEALSVVAELIKEDWRLRLVDGGEVEIACEDDECRALAETDFVVFDVETTSSKVPPGRVMEIGAYRVSRGRLVAEFGTLVNPECEIPPFVSRLTGITDSMVCDAPAFAGVAAEWLRFADMAVLVAHNAPFDVRFINYELARVFPGRRMANAHLCTVSLSRRLVPGLPNHRLHTLAEHFSAPLLNRHRAPDDARATAQVFLGLLDSLERGGVRSLAEARSFRPRPVAAPPQT